MTYGSETWVIKNEDERRCERDEMRMVRWMCDVTLKDRKPNVELIDMLGIESISEVMWRERLSWFRHVERMRVGSCVKRCINMNVNRRGARSCPRKTWDVLLRDNLRVEGLTRDHGKQGIVQPVKQPLGEPRLTHASMETAVKR